MKIYTFNQLRKKIGQICGESIGPEGFKDVIDGARQRGGFQNAEIQKTLTEILLYLEANASEQHEASQVI